MKTLQSRVTVNFTLESYTGYYLLSSEENNLTLAVSRTIYSGMWSFCDTVQGNCTSSDFIIENSLVRFLLGMSL